MAPRRYGGGFPSLDGIDLTVPEGTVTALPGPNGAGKTTAVRVFTTLLKPDGGAPRWLVSTWSTMRGRCGPGSVRAANTPPSTST